MDHHALVLTSEYEGLPLSLLEAMAQYCVPIVTELESGIGEILVDGHNGLVSPIGDMKSMASNINKLQDRDLLGRLGNHAFETLQQYKLTSPQMAEQYSVVLEDIFRQVLSDQEKPTVPLRCPHVESMLKIA